MINRRLLGAIAACSAMSASLLLGAPAAMAQTSTNLTASGSGAEEVPAGAGEEGTTITGSFQLSTSGALTYTVSIDGNAEPITAGHIHKGTAGVNGDVVVPLDPAAINAGTSATTQVDPALAAQILAQPGGYYLNAHSPSFAPPAGNARARLAAGAAAPGSINTGSGGQAAADADVAGTTVYLVSGLAIAGAVLVMRRQRETRS